MTSLLRIACFAVPSVVFAASNAHAQSRDSATARRADSITVVVTAIDADGRALLADVEVRFGSARVARTDWTGEASTTWRRGDSLVVRVARAGYAPYDTALKAPDADYLQLSVALTRMAQQLAATEVTAAVTEVPPMHPALADIALRRARYKGYYVTPEQLAKARERPMLEALRTYVPTVRLDYLNGGYVAKSGRGPTSIQGRRNQISAEILVYIDGVYQPVPEIDKMRAGEFIAVEYYPETTVPPQYRRAGAQNGVLLLWSK